MEASQVAAQSLPAAVESKSLPKSAIKMPKYCIEHGLTLSKPEDGLSQCRKGCVILVTDEYVIQLAGEIASYGQSQLH